MIWCWGKEVTSEESWRGLRGSEEVIERRREAEDMMVRMMMIELDWIGKDKQMRKQESRLSLLWISVSELAND